MTTYNWIMIGVVGFNFVCAFVAFFLYNPIIKRLDALEKECVDINRSVTSNHSAVNKAISVHQYEALDKFVKDADFKSFIDRNNKTLDDLNAYLKALLKS